MSNGEALIRALLSIGLGAPVGLYDAVDWTERLKCVKPGAPRRPTQGVEVVETLRHGLQLQMVLLLAAVKAG